MAGDAQFAVQDAIHDALVAASAVTTLVGTDNVHDHTDAGTTYPYIVIGEVAAVPFDVKGTDGMDQTVQIDTWSRYRGSKEAKDIMRAVYQTLHRASLTIAGQDLVQIRWTFSDIDRDPDGLTRHGIQQFQVITQTQ